MPHIPGHPPIGFVNFDQDELIAQPQPAVFGPKTAEIGSFLDALLAGGQPVGRPPFPPGGLARQEITPFQQGRQAVTGRTMGETANLRDAAALAQGRTLKTSGDEPETDPTVAEAALAAFPNYLEEVLKTGRIPPEWFVNFDQTDPKVADMTAELRRHQVEYMVHSSAEKLDEAANKAADETERLRGTINATAAKLLSAQVAAENEKDRTLQVRLQAEVSRLQLHLHGLEKQFLAEQNTLDRAQDELLQRQRIQSQQLLGGTDFLQQLLQNPGALAAFQIGTKGGGLEQLLGLLDQLQPNVAEGGLQ